MLSSYAYVAGFAVCDTTNNAAVLEGGVEV